jgi:hypothetical protein
LKIILWANSAVQYSGMQVFCSFIVARAAGAIESQGRQPQPSLVKAEKILLIIVVMSTLQLAPYLTKVYNL